MKFMRFHEALNPKGDKRVVSVTVKPLVEDCTGEIRFSDLQFQEQDILTGYLPNTSEMLPKVEQPKKYFNGIVRGSAIAIVFNTGETSTGLDCYIYPNNDISAGGVQLSQGKLQGIHKAVFKQSAKAGDELILKASSRQSLKNGVPTAKKGFYQYSAAACDSKHHMTLEPKKSARVYFEFKEKMEEVKF